MHHLSIDIETYSSVPIGKTGLYKYAQSPDFEVLLLAYSWDGQPVEVLDLASGDRVPDWLFDALYDGDVIKHAYNAAFEWYCLSRHFGLELPLDQWRCTMLHTLYCGYPASLDAAGRALGLPEDKRKQTAGKALIRTFCVPCTPTKSNGGRARTLPRHEPEKWRLFVEYNRQDVAAEMEIERLLSPWPVPETVQRQWETDQRINARGVAVDRDLLDGALWCRQQTTERLRAEAVALSGVENPGSVQQLTKWLEAETGEEIVDLRKETVSDLLGTELSSGAARRMLEIRQELCKTSTKKYDAMAAAICADGRLRGLMQFYGANRTGRWAGRIVQPQNLPRTYLEPLPLARQLVRDRKLDLLPLLYGSVPDTLSQLVRTALAPAPGKVFVDADFSAIEARVIAWLAGEEWVLEVFRSHGKIYEATASQMFGVPLEQIVKGRPEYSLRQKGKVATLALGYQGGTGALIQMGALRMGLTEEELPDIVRRWRASNKRIQDFWYALENAAIQTVETGRSTTVGRLRLSGTGDASRAFLTIQLPSGRALFYAQPLLRPGKFGRDQLFYWGMDQASHKWGAVDTYGGKLAENVTQAVARDCLAEAIERLEAAGYPVVFHVHDEVVLEVDKETADLQEVCRIMAQAPSWAEGLPLNAEGWVDLFYKKD